MGSYSPGVGMAVDPAGAFGDAVAEGDGLAAAEAGALGRTDAGADADVDADAEEEPLGSGVMIGVGLGEGKSLLGTFANDRAKTSTKRTKTITTQIRARLS
jgi:hypothetical protein